MKPPRNTNVVWTEGHLSPEARAAEFGHQPATVWLTGLSGSGKSTVAFAVESWLMTRGVHACVLDGDNVRHGLNADLGFSPEDREENIRRVGHVARLLYDAGLVVITAFISPYRRDRERVRALHPSGGFVEVHLDTPIGVCEQRDVKGLYRRARAGEIPDFSGVSAPYEPPEHPEVRIDTSNISVEACVARIVRALDVVGTERSGDEGSTR